MLQRLSDPETAEWLSKACSPSKASRLPGSCRNKRESSRVGGGTGGGGEHMNGRCMRWGRHSGAKPCGSLVCSCFGQAWPSHFLSQGSTHGVKSMASPIWWENTGSAVEMGGGDSDLQFDAPDRTKMLEESCRLQLLALPRSSLVKHVFVKLFRLLLHRQHFNGCDCGHLSTLAISAGGLCASRDNDKSHFSAAAPTPLCRRFWI
jgi:hypothetical protein